MTTNVIALPPDTIVDLAAILRRQREAFARDMAPAKAVRDDRLRRLDALVRDNAAHFAELIARDFGRRPALVTHIADINTVRAAIRHARGHLGGWMRPRRAATGWASRPGSSRIMRQPLGVVGIIGAWNFPLNLTLAPLVCALAAGNRAMIKPPELTPLFADALRAAVAEAFAEDEVAVVTGGPETGQAFAALPFDHLVFTGSTRVGRLVAQAAAKNLTPVTLELGGKSPLIVDVSADLKLAAERTAWGKFFNAGQICIAPDYALVARGKLDPFVDALRTAIAKQYPTIGGNPDYTSLISASHHERLRGLVDDARAKGARVIEVGAAAPGTRTMAPTLLLDVTDTMEVMRQEIFGPVLPIIPYDLVDDAIAFVNARERPLSLYWFGSNAAARERVLATTISGGVSVNETLMHFVQEDLPFGGVGPSGTGHYHGAHGFERLSKEKPVFIQSRFSSGFMLYPPYTWFSRMLVRILARWS